MQLLHLDIEDGVLAGQLLARIVGREGDLDLALVAGLGADQLILESRDQHAGAKAQMMAFGLAAGEFLAVDAAGEIDHQDIVLHRRTGFGHRLALRLLLGDALQRLLDLGIGNFDDVAGQLQLAEIDGLDLRHQLDIHACIRDRSRP